jgi:hypothetical protein
MSGSKNIRQVHREKVKEMKTNVINSQFAIEYHNGILEIIGVVDREAVVFRLSGHSVSDLLRDQPSFCKNSIFTNDVHSRENIFIFEYSLREELRNPKKLLRSVRNKLIQAGFRNRNEEDKEYNEMYSVPDREEHRMFN